MGGEEGNPGSEPFEFHGRKQERRPWGINGRGPTLWKEMADLERSGPRKVTGAGPEAVPAESPNNRDGKAKYFGVERTKL